MAVGAISKSGFPNGQLNILITQDCWSVWLSVDGRIESFFIENNLPNYGVTYQIQSIRSSFLQKAMQSAYGKFISMKD